VTARTRRGACPSGKTRYRNRLAVIGGIDTTRYRHWQHYRQPAPRLYLYRCPMCTGWHMTSQTPRENGIAS
jgi:hypothetical protein